MSLLPAVHSYGQETTTSDNESRRSAGDDALVPLTSGPPLTAREEEMLRLIKGLQERVAHLEAREGSDAGDVQPAAHGDYAGSSQARLLEASIVSLPRADGRASLAVLHAHGRSKRHGKSTNAKSCRVRMFDKTGCAGCAKNVGRLQSEPWLQSGQYRVGGDECQHL